MPAKSSLDSARRFSPSRLFSLFIVSCVWLVPMLLLGTAASAMAADTYTVTVLTDDYAGGGNLNGTPSNCPANGIGTNCSLRDAMTAANSDPGSSVIFHAGLSGRIPVGFVLPEIVVNMTVDGGSAIILDGLNGTTPFAVYNAQTATPINVTIQNFTLQNGNGQSLAATGGIQNQYANLTVNNVAFLNVTAGSSGFGGAIYNNGTLTVNNSFFFNCTANNGGAIYNDTGGNLTVNGSTFNKLYATQSASIFQYSTTLLVVTNSTFTGNSAIYGAGIYSINNANLTVKDSTFFGNTAEDGGGVSYTGVPTTVVTLENNYFAENNECYADPGAPICPTNGQYGNYVGPSSSTTLAAAGLLPLSYYGGLTPTMLPMPGSPGICAGIAADVPTGVTKDQRGFPLKTSCVDAGAVQTNYLTVSKSSDDASGIAADCPGSSCGLRDAIAYANAAGYGDIDFANGLASIALTSAGPTVGPNVNIVGPGAGSLTVSGANQYAILETSGGDASLFGMTFANGNNTANGTGGAIDNLANLTVNGMYFTGNSAATSGGAIYNGGSGSVTVIDSTFANNTAPDGSAIYDNSATGGLLMKYSTIANNTASADGAIYSGSGAAVNVYNSTLAGNTGGGLVIGGGSTLTVENSILGESTECSGSTSCPATGTLGNVVAPTNLTSGIPALSALGNYSGTSALFSTPTILPEPGSSAICAASATLIPSGINTDQRGFLNENYTYPGYPYTAPCYDAGAVQTDYTSAQFVGAPYAAAANSNGATPPVIVSVTENGQNVGGVTVPLSFTGTGTASGLTATTVEGTGATFSSLNVNQASGALPDTLSTSIPVIGTFDLTAGPANLTVQAQVVTWPTPSAITYGTALSATQLDATSTVNGTFSYSPAAGTVLTAGTHILVATFTPSNGSLGTLTNTVTITVNKATPVITWATPAAITSGTALSSTQLDATASVGTASVAGTFAYSPAAGTIPSAGTDTLSVTFTPTDTTDYNTATASVSLVVNQGAAPTITWPTPSAITYGTALSATQLDATASVNGSFSYSPAAGTVLTAGSHVITATFTPSNASLGTVTSTVTITVNKVTPVITWAAPAAITSGTALSSTQLDATASVGTASVSGTFAYSPAAGTIPSAGTDTLSVTFTPTDTTDYNTATASVSLVVNQASTPTITWPTPSAITYGTALSATQLDATASVAGTFTYSPAAGTVLKAGSQTLSATFKPTSTSLSSVTTTVTLTVNQANPVITWTNPPNIVYGTPITTADQNATANVPGSFVYTAPLGTVYTAGLHPLGVAFFPTDQVDYADVSGYAYVTVTKATPVISWATPAAILYGTTLSSTQLNATANVAGTFAYSPAAGTVPAVGTDTLTVTFTPSDTTDYNTTSASVLLTVASPATPIVPYIQVNGGTWQNISSVTVAAGSTVNLGPQPSTGGSWSWTGTAGFTSTSRQISSIPLLSGVNTYVATYTNTSGVTSSQTFTITVTGWQEIGTSVSNMSVGSDGTLVVVNSSVSTIWEFTAATGAWTQLPGTAKEVAVVNANSIWSIGTNRNVYHLVSGAWVQVGVSADAIAAGSDGTVIAADYPNQTIWKYVAGSNWTQVPFGLSSQVSVVKNNDYFILGNGPGYWLWDFTGSAWSAIGESAYSWVSAASDGTVITTTSAGNIYQYVSPGNFTQITGTMKEVVVQKAGAYYAIGEDGNVYGYGTH